MRIREATPADVSDLARVHVDSWRTTYRGIVPDEYLAQLSYESREGLWKRVLSRDNRAGGGFCFVAEDEETARVVGFASGGPEWSGSADSPYKGEIYAIYILEPYQGQGLGRRLIAASIDRLAGAGIYSLLVWVAARNRACGFYEALGGRKVYEKQDEIDGITLDEVAYGWADTRLLK